MMRATADRLGRFRRRPWLAANLLSFFGVFVYVLMRGPMMAPDTALYLVPHWSKNAGYAWFLRTASALFGDGFPWIVIVLQILLVCAAIVYVSRVFAQLFAHVRVGGFLHRFEPIGRTASVENRDQALGPEHFTGAVARLEQSIGAHQ